MCYFGTQKWNGAILSFMVRAIVMSMDAVGLNSFVTVHWLAAGGG